MLLLLHEKFSSGNDEIMRYALSRTSICYRKLRLTFSFAADFYMLFYAVLSVIPYIFNRDVITCRRIKGNFVLSIDICLAVGRPHNIPFFLLFYLATFTHDYDKDIDRVYQF